MSIDEQPNRSLVPAPNSTIAKRSEALVARGVRDFELAVEGPAKYNLGVKLEFGAHRNFAAAAEHYTKAAEFGHVAAQCLLSDMYETGQGVKRDHREASRWFSKAREAIGPSDSMVEETESSYAQHLADFCHLGHPDGVDENVWLTNLACQRTDHEQGDAFYHIGMQYSGGLGRQVHDFSELPSQDLVKAYMWFRLSAEAYERAISTGVSSLPHCYSLGLAAGCSRWMCRLAIAKLDNAEIARAETLATERVRGSQRGKRVLVVDDEEPIREIILSMLETEGFRCSYAESGNKALALLDSGHDVDLITSCLLMADLDGIGLLEQVKINYPDIPFAILSAVHDLSVVEAAIRWGASDYLLKPFERSQLVATVQRALRTA